MTTQLRPISAQDAEAEPESERLFPPQIEISTIVAYRGRDLRIAAQRLDADRFCDMLDRRFGPAPQAGGGAPPPSRTVRTTQPGEPICPIHGRPMRRMARPDRQGHTHWCTAQEGSGFCGERA